MKKKEKKAKITLSDHYMLLQNLSHRDQKKLLPNKHKELHSNIEDASLLIVEIC